MPSVCRKSVSDGFITETPSRTSAGRLQLTEVYTTEITYILDTGIVSPTAFICRYLLKKKLIRCGAAFRSSGRDHHSWNNDDIPDCRTACFRCRSSCTCHHHKICYFHTVRDLCSGTCKKTIQKHNLRRIL